MDNIDNITKFKNQFIKFCLDNKALKFGEFTLKSGLKSPYFFNIGEFNNNLALSMLGEYYADLIYNNLLNQNNNKNKINCLFGPAYKGIPLVVATSIALSNKYNYQIDIAFNRKEAKTHGEGGEIIGCDITNKNILLIDDVISAGTATLESIKLLSKYHAKLTTIAIALDRQMHTDKNNFDSSVIASDNIKKLHNINILNIINLNDIREYTKQTAEYNYLTEKLVNPKSNNQLTDNY